MRFNHAHLSQIKEMMGLCEALCKPGDVLGTCLFRKQAQLIREFSSYVPASGLLMIDMYLKKCLYYECSIP